MIVTTETHPLCDLNAIARSVGTSGKTLVLEISKNIFFRVDVSRTCIQGSISASRIEQFSSGIILLSNPPTCL